MKVNWGQTLFGLILGSITPLGLGMLIAMPQGVSPHTFLWAITHFEWYYNSIFQLGVAANIGIFFFVDEEGCMDLFQSRLVAGYHFDDHLGGDH